MNLELLPSLLSSRCFWRWGTILNAEDADDDTEGGVVLIEGDVVESGTTCPGCNLLNGDTVPTLLVSWDIECDEFDILMTCSLNFWFAIVLGAAAIEEPDMKDEFANVDELNCIDLSFTLTSLSWLLSVVIFTCI